MFCSQILTQSVFFICLVLGVMLTDVAEATKGKSKDHFC